MKISGCTIKGSYKEINQDSYIANKFKNVFYLAVADGLGSKKYSEKGSKFACYILEKYIKKTYKYLNVLPIEKIFYSIYFEWIKYTSKYGTNNCSSTFLFVINTKKRIISFRIGDGFIFLKTNKRVEVLFDNKEESFSNITTCLNEKIDFKDKNLEILDIKDEKLENCLLMTDGIDLYPETKETYINFSKEFFEEYSSMEIFEINKNIKKWFNLWESIDDKTLTYFISGGKFSG